MYQLPGCTKRFNALKVEIKDTVFMKAERNRAKASSVVVTMINMALQVICFIHVNAINARTVESPNSTEQSTASKFEENPYLN